MAWGWAARARPNERMHTHVYGKPMTYPGTGHDVNDYEIGKRFGLEIINIMNDDGTLNANAGAYASLDRFAARKQLWKDMEVGTGCALLTP
jgi:valyl-tRNA synthetase